MQFVCCLNVLFDQNTHVNSWQNLGVKFIGVINRVCGCYMCVDLLFEVHLPLFPSFPHPPCLLVLMAEFMTGIGANCCCYYILCFPSDVLNVGVIGDSKDSEWGQ